MNVGPRSLLAAAGLVAVALSCALAVSTGSPLPLLGAGAGGLMLTAALSRQGGLTTPAVTILSATLAAVSRTWANWDETPDKLIAAATLCAILWVVFLLMAIWVSARSRKRSEEGSQA